MVNEKYPGSEPQGPSELPADHPWGDDSSLNILLGVLASFALVLGGISYIQGTIHAHHALMSGYAPTTSQASTNVAGGSGVAPGGAGTSQPEPEPEP